MVGIPGTSKGCITCRRRKLGCDQLKPNCQRCIRTGRQCEGYGGPIDRVRKRKPTVAEQSSSQTPPQHEQALVSQTSSVSGGQSSQQVLQIDNSRVSDQALFSRFLDDYFPQDILAQHDFHLTWMQRAAGLPNGGEALRVALRALVASRLGWLHSKPDLYHEGKSSYVASLSALQRALYSRKHAHRDETLATGKILMTYELFEATTKNGWHSHLEGLSTMISSRRPETFHYPLAEAILESYYTPAMFHALMNRSVSFLTRPEWRADLTGRVDALRMLYDIGLRLAAFLHEQDARKVSRSAHAAEKGHFTESHSFRLYDVSVWRSDLEQYVGFDLELQSFYKLLVSQYSERKMPLYWDAEASSSTSMLEEVPGSSPNGRYSSLFFINLTVAQGVMNYWALQALVSGPIAELTEMLRAAETDNNWSMTSDFDDMLNLEADPKDPNQEHLALPATSMKFSYDLDDLASKHNMTRCHHLAIQIVRSISYCIAPKMGLIGPERCLGPLRAAMIVLKQCGNQEDLAWAETTFINLSSTKGLGFTQRLLDLGERWDEVEKGGEYSGAGTFE